MRGGGAGKTPLSVRGPRPQTGEGCPGPARVRAPGREVAEAAGGGTARPLLAGAAPAAGSRARPPPRPEEEEEGPASVNSFYLI